MFKLISFVVLVFSAQAFSQTITQENIKQGNVIEDPSKYPFGEFVIDRFIYEDRAYSTARKTELGDSVELEMALRYQRNNTSFSRFRFETDPSENRVDNETSNFEIIYNRKFQNFTFQIDLDLNTNENRSSSDEGGTVLGLDLDSDDTYISYEANEKVKVTFYPFNFRADVGGEFNTRDVTEISYIDGSPTTIQKSPSGSEKFVSKTIPGFEMQYNFKDSYVYTGFGVASYLYPTNSDFDIEDNPSATAWERKEATAFKLGYILEKKNDSRITVQHVNHSNTDETGALLESASSVTALKDMGNWLTKVEFTQTTAGNKAYNLSRTGEWYEDTTLGKPVYSDVNGDKQDWVGKTGHAYAFKLGVRYKSALPYISLKQHSEKFVYSADESAHRLRVDDESKGHGGLTRVAVGSFFFYENLFFNPKFEWQQAKNPVFSNSTDVSNDRLQSSFKKENIILSLNVNFSYDGANLNPNWWF